MPISNPLIDKGSAGLQGPRLDAMPGGANLHEDLAREDDIIGSSDRAFGLTLAGQLAVFAAASALSSLAGYFIYRQLHWGRRGEIVLNERGRALVGARGTVCEAFVNGSGKVRLGDGVWLAAGPDLAEGTPVVVSAVHGTRLFVQAAASGTAANA